MNVCPPALLAGADKQSGRYLPHSDAATWSQGIYNVPVYCRKTNLSDLGSIFELKIKPHEGSYSESVLDEIRCAAAVLLMVCAKSDFEEHPEELRAISDLLRSTFALPPEKVEELLSLLDDDRGVRQLQEVTELVNEHYTESDKHILVENLWAVAFADGRLDRFEEQFISRVAFMIDVSPTAVTACRKTVAAQRESLR